MKLDSKYFDSIRIAPREEPAPKSAAPKCQWRGCAAPGVHKAPKGRGQDGAYYRFCVDHVRQFNATYNYFDGMSTAEVEDYQKSATTGHRPTWKLGENAGSAGRSKPSGASPYAKFAADPHEFLGASGEEQERTRGQRHLRPLERKALETMHLSETSSKAEIKARFKQLVKRHHPDSNGGDRGSEEKLREIIQAYNYLKQAGLV